MSKSADNEIVDVIDWNPSVESIDNEEVDITDWTEVSKLVDNGEVNVIDRRKQRYQLKCHKHRVANQRKLNTPQKSISCSLK